MIFYNVIISIENIIIKYISAQNILTETRY